MKIQKNVPAPKIRETEENLLELEKSPHNLQKYYDYDDTEYQFVASNEQFANNE